MTNFSMLGPIVNAASIVICSLAGCFLLKSIPSRIEEIIMKAIGLFVIYAGLKGAFDSQRTLLLLMSLVSGAVIGELINIDGLINRLGAWAGKRLSMPGEGKRSFSKGFTSASILYCTGSIIIVGSLQSGLTGKHDILFMKSVLDGVVSIIFAAAMGIGVAFSALPLFICEAAIVLLSGAVKDFLSAEIIREMSAAGSILMMAIGFNFLGVKEVKIANFIPAIFIPLVYISLEGIFRA